MKIGYSDDVVVFLNGHPICAGNNSIGARGPEFLGLLSVSDDAVYLPLKKGDNELVLAVTEFFGEWGFICQMSDDQPALKGQVIQIFIIHIHCRNVPLACAAPVL